jgi:hypothetical protein
MHYSAGNTVTLGGVTYTALSTNTNQNPATKPLFWQVYQPVIPYTPGAAWSATTTYSTGNTATLGGVTYTALSTNTNQNPATKPLFWQVYQPVIPYTPGAAWSATRAYDVGNTVTYGGVNYTALTANTNQNPAASGEDWRDNTPYTAGAPWSARMHYSAGNTATLGGVTYTALSGNNNQNPATSSDYWEVYQPVIPYTPGAAWSATTTYSTGNTATLGGVTYAALSTNTNQNPATKPAFWEVYQPVIPYTPGAVWSATTTYAAGNTATLGGVTYTALSANSNQTPSASSDYWEVYQPVIPYTAGAAWSATTNYAAGNTVTLGGVTYTALSANVNQTPSASSAFWQTRPSSYAAEEPWSDTRAYATGNTVTYGEVTYTALSANTNQIPSATSTYWQAPSTYTAGAAWSATRAYATGNTVTYGGVTYTALSASTNQTPSATSTYWQTRPSSYAAGEAWSDTRSYVADNTVTLGGVTYSALASSTNQNPATSSVYWEVYQPVIPYTPGAAWSATTTYSTGNTATLGGVTYAALSTNVNQNPATKPAFWEVYQPVIPYTAGETWSATRAYATGNTVTYGGVTYTALSASTNQIPSATSTYWRGPGGGTADAAEADAKKKKGEGETMLYIGIAVAALLVVGVLAVSMSRRR